MEYTVLDPIEHVRRRPDTYIGSKEPVTRECFVADAVEGPISKREITFNPGLYKIFDEALVNAIDRSKRDESLTYIKVAVEGGRVRIKNDGAPIPVVKHHQMTDLYVPVVVFGVLLSGNNFDDSQGRLTGGRNGLGVKLTNILSTRFDIEVVDRERNLKLTHSWEGGMVTRSEDTKVKRLAESSKERSSVTVSFVPDFEYFGEAERAFSEDTVALFRRRVMDAAGCTPRPAVSFDGKTIKVKRFVDYVRLYETNGAWVEHVFGPWRLAVSRSAPGSGYSHVSSVNGVVTPMGGTHVDMACNALVRALGQAIKGAERCTTAMKAAIFLVVHVDVANPSFSSQSKDACNTPASRLPRFELPAEVAKKVVDRLKLREVVAESERASDRRLLASTNGTKSWGSALKIPKLDDAPKAGTRDSHRCTLLLTEGDSAKSFAVAGVGALDRTERDYWGIFPLKGKLLNVSEASAKQLAANAEVTRIQRIVGLKHGTSYESIRQLRYGRLVVLADADSDGYHILGLIIHFVETFWPNLVDLGFVCSLRTPIIRAIPSAGKGSCVEFFSERAFSEWINDERKRRFKIRYYKGLGTHTSAEAKAVFGKMDLVRYTRDDEGHRSMQLAFSGSRSDERKGWIVAATATPPKELTGPEMSLTEFVNNDLVRYGLAASERALPSVWDGLKPSQRKILFTLLESPEADEIKVAQLAAKVALRTIYKHGETSLASAIVNLAQDFVGAGNVNLLQPIGCFGTRLLGGKDAASPRYIFTKLSAPAPLIFRREDSALLRPLTEEGERIEFEHLAPVLPMLLVNGCSGIAWGFSTSIHPRDPKTIMANLRLLLDVGKGAALLPMPPFWRKFRGTVESAGEGKSWVVKGSFERAGNATLRITELPVGTWTETYKEVAEGMDGVARVHATSTEEEVRIDLVFESERCLSERLEGDAERALRLRKNVDDGNMYAFDTGGVIRKYGSVEEMLLEFFDARLELYGRRKARMLSDLEEDLRSKRNQRAFVDAVVAGRIAVWRRPAEEVVDDILKVATAADRTEARNMLKMQLASMTSERLVELEGRIGSLETQIAVLEGKTPQLIWSADLDALEKYL